MSWGGLVGVPLLVRGLRPTGRLTMGLHAVRALDKSKRRALYLSAGLVRGVGGRRTALSLSAGLA